MVAWGADPNTTQTGYAAVHRRLDEHGRRLFAAEMA